MRLCLPVFAAFILLAHVGVFSCDSHHNDLDIFDDVTVDITGTSGVDFDARFEDDDHTQTATGVVPFSAAFTDQVNFLRAVADKNSSGSGQICVKVTSTHDSKQECTTDPNGRVSVTVVF